MTFFEKLENQVCTKHSYLCVGLDPVWEKIPPHLGNLREDYQRFRNFALNRKQVELMDLWFERAKGDVFINIDPEYNSCDIMN